MESKESLERWYSKEDPWGFNSTVPDRIRRAILLKHIESVFSDGSRKTVLDAGCGEGYITKDVARKYNADIDAFDISENALVTARSRNSHENINYFQLDLKEYVPKKKYDLILCEEALYYLSDDDRIGTIRKFHDSIRVGGYLRVTAIIIGETQWRKYFTPESIKNLMVDNGFQIMSIVPSVLQKRNVTEKAFYRLLEYMNKAKLIGPNLVENLGKIDPQAASRYLSSNLLAGNKSLARFDHDGKRAWQILFDYTPMGVS